MISFNKVPSNVRVPFAFVEFDPSGAQQGANLLEYKVLLLGQKLAAGTAAAEGLDLVTSKEQAADLYGEGSILHGMFEAFFASNKFTKVYGMALDDDGAAVAATGTVTFSGTATEAGTVYLYVAGRRVKVAVANGDSASAVATAAAAAINADTSLPVTAAVDGTISEQVNVTARNKGEAGNDIDLRVNYQDDESLPAGIAAPTFGAMSGGTTNPTLTNAISAMGDTWFHIIGFPYTDTTSLDAISTELDDRWGPMRQIEGVAMAAKNDTVGNLSTFGGNRNDKFVSVMGTTGSPMPAYEWAAELSAVTSFHGAIDPARPFQTLALEHCLPAQEVDRLTLQERNTLLHDGIAAYSADDAGKARISRLITTYQTNELGADDTSFLDVNTPLTLGYLRYDLRTFWLTKYPRHKLAQDGKRYGAGQAIMTPKLAKAEVVARFRLWERQGLVEGPDQFKDDLIVERNTNDPNRLDIQMSPDLVNQLRVTGVKVPFLL